MDNKKDVLIVGIGGTTRAGSSTEMALRAALREAEAQGANTVCYSGADLDFPMYDPAVSERTELAARMVFDLERCDGVIISSPGFHGSISGMIKNAIDYIEDLNNAERVYLDGRAVGLITCAYGWQATGTTMNTLRSITHSLRAWPTPFGVTINSLQTKFDGEGNCSDDNVQGALKILARQVVNFATRFKD